MKRFQAFVVDLVVCSAVGLTVEGRAQEVSAVVSAQGSGYSAVERGPDYRVLSCELELVWNFKDQRHGGLHIAIVNASYSCRISNHGIPGVDDECGELPLVN